MSAYVYPKTRRDESVVDSFHGVQIKDPYRFLEDPESEETKQFVAEQNVITNSFLDKCEYRQKIQERITSLWNYPKFGIPFKRGDFYYYFKNSGLQNQSVLYQQATLDGEAKEFLDPNKFVEDGTSALQQLEFSEDGKMLAYIVCEKGSDWGTVKFMSVETGQVLEKDTLSNVKFSCLCWTHDNKGVFYNQFPRSAKSDGTSIQKNEFQQLCYHRVGSEQAQDVVVAHFPDNSNWMGHAEVSDCGNYLFVSISQSCEPTNQFWYYDLKAANFEVTANLTFNKLIDNFDSRWDYITNEGSLVTFKTNESKSLRYKLLTIDLANNKWNTLVPETADVLQGVQVFDQNKLILNYMRDCKDELYLYDLASGQQTKKFNIEIGTVSVSARKKESSFFYKHTSFTSPGDIYRFEVTPGQSVASTEPVLFRRSSFAGVDLSGFETEQVFYTSKDGKTKIPMFLISKKGLKKSEDTPTVLYAYGGFNISLTPTFSVTRLIWLQHFNGVYAIANIRGGGEYGEEWYNAGRLFNKQNCFDDFCSAADHLIENRMTSSKRLIINGGSNGGLLVTACINQRPDLFFGAIADVPVCDMLRFHKFTIGSYWVSDFGCADKKDEFDYMIKYSPLHTIKKGAKYPYVLLATADHDDRVVPSHSYKYIQELQHQNGDQDTPFLIRIETKAGHGAGKPTSKVIQEYSDKFGFLAKILSLEWQD